MLITTQDYYGLPKELVPDLERITQTTLDQMFELAKRVYEDPTIELWNCKVERNLVRAEAHYGTSMKQLKIDNYSSGYWAIIQFGQLYPKDELRWDFWVFATDSDNTHVDLDKPSWRDFNKEWAYGRASLFWQAAKLSSEEGWWALPHAISFRHPLLMLLRQGCETKDNKL